MLSLDVVYNYISNVNTDNTMRHQRSRHIMFFPNVDENFYPVFRLDAVMSWVISVKFTE